MSFCHKTKYVRFLLEWRLQTFFLSRFQSSLELKVRFQLSSSIWFTSILNFMVRVCSNFKYLGIGLVRSAIRVCTFVSLKWSADNISDSRKKTWIIATPKKRRCYPDRSCSAEKMRGLTTILLLILVIESFI